MRIFYCGVGVFLSLAGCGSRGEFSVSPTSGRVMCEGKPVPHVTVFFEPLMTGKSAITGKQGVAQADADGRFVVSTYGRKDGAVVGKHRVRVAAPDRDSFPKFSCECLLDSEVDVAEVEVKRGEKNDFEIVLKKKTGREKPSLDELEALEEAARR